MPRALLLLLLLYGWQASATVAVRVRLTPAGLTEGPHSIESLLRIPDGLELGRYEIHCEAWILTHGHVNRFICYYDKGTPALLRAVARAGRAAKFVPATRDGKPAEVYMLVSVRIDITKQGPLVLVLPNDGVEAKRYGLFYTAPQRFTEFTWNGATRDYAPGVVVMWHKMQIDERGKVIDFKVENVSDAPQSLVTRIEEQVKRMEFTPGYFEGNPVPMFYAEPVLQLQ